MDSLKRIEALPAAQRSTYVGTFGVRDDLQKIARAEAIAWLEKYVASPVSSSWGGLLYMVGADWETLQRWLVMDKVHCLASCDALYWFASPDMDSEPRLPEGASPEQVVAAVDAAVATFGNPRIQKIQGIVRAAWAPRMVRPANASDIRALTKVASILLGNDSALIERWSALAAQDGSRDRSVLLHHLLHNSDGKHSIVVVDWKADLDDALLVFELPILADMSVDIRLGDFADSWDSAGDVLAGMLKSRGLAVGSIDMGSVEQIFVVLPETTMAEMELSISAALRKPFRIHRHTDRSPPNTSLERTREG